MKSITTALLVILVQIVKANPHCRRYRSCISGARDDYEQCVGGVAAATIGDTENTETSNFLLGQTDRIVMCEKRISRDVIEYRLARQHEDDDILKCTNVFSRHSSFSDVSEIKKIACAGMPTSWDLRDLVGNIMEKPSQCRELYDLQLQRCSFLLSCCPVYSLCTATVSLNSTVHSKVLSLRRKIADGAKQCLTTDPIPVDYGETPKQAAVGTVDKQETNPTASSFQAYKISTPESSPDNSGIRHPANIFNSGYKAAVQVPEISVEKVIATELKIPESTKTSESLKTESIVKFEPRPEIPHTSQQTNLHATLSLPDETVQISKITEINLPESAADTVRPNNVESTTATSLPTQKQLSSARPEFRTKNNSSTVENSEFQEAAEEQNTKTTGDSETYLTLNNSSPEIRFSGAVPILGTAVAIVTQSNNTGVAEAPDETQQKFSMIPSSPHPPPNLSSVSETSDGTKEEAANGSNSSQIESSTSTDSQSPKETLLGSTTGPESKPAVKIIDPKSPTAKSASSTESKATEESSTEASKTESTTQNNSSPGIRFSGAVPILGTAVAIVTQSNNTGVAEAPDETQQKFSMIPSSPHPPPNLSSVSETSDGTKEEAANGSNSSQILGSSTSTDSQSSEETLLGPRTGPESEQSVRIIYPESPTTKSASSTELKTIEESSTEASKTESSTTSRTPEQDYITLSGPHTTNFPELNATVPAGGMPSSVPKSGTKSPETDIAEASLLGSGPTTNQKSADGEGAQRSSSASSKSLNLAQEVEQTAPETAPELTNAANMTLSGMSTGNQEVPAFISGAAGGHSTTLEPAESSSNSSTDSGSPSSLPTLIFEEAGERATTSKAAESSSNSSANSESTSSLPTSDSSQNPISATDSKSKTSEVMVQGPDTLEFKEPLETSQPSSPSTAHPENPAPTAESGHASSPDQRTLPLQTEPLPQLNSGSARSITSTAKGDNIIATSPSSDPARFVSPSVFAILFPKLSTQSTKSSTGPTEIDAVESVQPLAGSQLTDASSNPTILDNRNRPEEEPLLSFWDESNNSSGDVQDVNRDLIHLTKDQGIAMCEKVLACDAKLKQSELMCQRRYAFLNLIFDAEMELSDMIVQAELMLNSIKAGATEAVSKACMRPITNIVLQQLAEFLNEMESSRISCTRRTASVRSLIAFRDKAMCEAMVTQAMIDELDDVDKAQFNNLKTRRNAFEYCAARIAPLRKQCTLFKLCCPSYARCSETMAETNVSKKYSEMMNGVKRIQNNCERKIMATLKTIQSGFVPLAPS